MRLTAALALALALAACGDGVGDEPESLLGGDGGTDDVEPSGTPPPEDLCAAFVERVCGPGGSTCLDSGGCQAALLIDSYEPERCAEGFGDTFVYPTCEADACTRLVDKVCGEQQTCTDTGGYQQAMRLDAQLKDEAADDDDRNAARDACAAGLVDDLVFPSCG